ncbi:MAG: helix-turn-helix transcriptional regulator [Bacteroidaceae bacterium]|nr:helix-turn-helix transcriptional regulator [Bacteroidaceae bacterium]
MKKEEGTWELFEHLIDAVPPEQKKQFDYSNEISDRLDAILKERGISQRKLARMTGKRPSEVTRWLSGQHNFTLATIAKLSVVLDYDFIVVQ